MRLNHLSASSLAAFKSCPRRYQLAYVEGLRPAVETVSQRVGTNWHALHETWHNAEGDKMAAVLALLNERYADVPATRTPEEWALEREILLRSFVAYQWFYANDPIEVLQSELAFKLPLREPCTGLNMPLAEVVRIGKIDHVIKWHNSVCALERKSTSKSIEPESDFWDRWRKDTQISMYASVFKEIRYKQWLRHTETETLLEIGDLPVGNTLLDTWHKPTIKPSLLTQAETKAFFESGEYQGEKFAAKFDSPNSSVNGVRVEVKEGKAGIAIRETAEMFGARLMADMQTRPGHYFQRREIARTDDEIKKFDSALWGLYQAQKLLEKNDAWYECESQCRATFACPYIPICYGPGADAVAKEGLTPPGFVRIFEAETTPEKTQEE